MTIATVAQGLPSLVSSSAMRNWRCAVPEHQVAKGWVATALDQVANLVANIGGRALL
jgi:hypothetical protein